jgi:phosphoglycolate phosphatase
MKRLVLFDIDGTILSSSGAGRVAMERALRDTFGTPGDPEYHYDGKTDRQIVRESMRLAEISEADIDAKIDLAMERYIAGLHDTLNDDTHPVQIYEGIESLIDAVDTRHDLTLGLLTGNVERGARLKLTAAGIDFDRFIVNAFGSDHEVRGELPGVAHRRMRDVLGVELPGRDVIVIGDTPADVQCGRTLGARAIAVATGRYSIDDLRMHDPYAVFETLGDTDTILRLIDA